MTLQIVDLLLVVCLLIDNVSIVCLFSLIDLLKYHVSDNLIYFPSISVFCFYHMIKKSIFC